LQEPSAKGLRAGCGNSCSQLFGGLARGRADSLRFPDELARCQAGAQPLGAAQETRHRCPAKTNGCIKGGSAHLRLVVQSILKDFCFAGGFGHGPILVGPMSCAAPPAQNRAASRRHPPLHRLHRLDLPGQFLRRIDGGGVNAGVTRQLAHDLDRHAIHQRLAHKGMVRPGRADIFEPARTTSMPGCCA